MTKAIEITAQEIFDRKQILTLETAEKLIGKTIAITNPEYRGNKPTVRVFTIIKIISCWDEAATRPYINDKFTTWQDYWKSYMNKEKIKEQKNLIGIIGENGKLVSCGAYLESPFFDVPVFTGSDMDREVYYIEL